MVTTPLEGLRVVDVSPDRVGAQVSQTLADYGADVVWIEPPGGSRLRQQRAFPFLARGKRSVVADLHTDEGVERVGALAASADVFIETFRPGVADRLGLGYDALAASNPGLVYTSITGFGRHGPWASLKGYEGVVASVLGVYGSFAGMSPGAQNASGRPPFVTVPWCTHAASSAAIQGILTALLERDRSGRGQWVETNLAQAVTIHEGASSSWYTYLVHTRWPEAFVSAPTVAHHFTYRLLVAQTKDGRWLQFAQNRPHLFESFLRALGLDWMLTDPAWKGIPVLEDDAQRAELLRLMLDGVRDQDPRRVAGGLRSGSRRVGRALPRGSRGARPPAARGRRVGHRARRRGARRGAPAGPAVRDDRDARRGAVARAGAGRRCRHHVGAACGGALLGVGERGRRPMLRHWPASPCSSWRCSTRRRTARRCWPISGRGSSRSSSSRATPSAARCRSSPRSAPGRSCRARRASRSTSGRPKVARSCTGSPPGPTCSSTGSGSARPSAAGSTPTRCTRSTPT